ncbi:MAG: PEP-CTERM sorting domain-containing protein [Tepidisphaeraceae bacterium]
MTACGLVAAAAANARAAVLLESWENSANGWVTTTEQPTYSIAGFSTSAGVTDGSFSMIISGTAAPSYGQLFRGPQTTDVTNALANAQSVSVDVLADASFGFQQWSLILNGGGLGYTSVDGFSFSQSPTLGTQSTLTWNLTPAMRATLAANPTVATEIIFQIGGGAGGTMHVDNLRFTAVPEPATAGWLGIAATAWILRRRRLWIRI